MPACHLSAHARQDVLVGRADGRRLLVVRVGVLEDVQERLELRRDIQVRRAERVQRRRHVPDVVGHVDQRRGVRRHEVDEQPGLVGVRRTLRDPDDRATDRTAPVGVALIVGHGVWRRRVRQVGSLVGDERRPPLTVEVHRHPPVSKSCADRELVPRAGDEPLQLVRPRLEVAASVHVGDEIVLPLEHGLPRRIAVHHRAPCRRRCTTSRRRGSPGWAC